MLQKYSSSANSQVPQRAASGIAEGNPNGARPFRVAQNQRSRYRHVSHLSIAEQIILKGAQFPGVKPPCGAAPLLANAT